MVELGDVQGVLGGGVAAVILLLGLQGRLKRVEKNKVSKEACTLVQAGIRSDIKHIKEGQGRIESKVDKLDELIRNGPKKT